MVLVLMNIRFMCRVLKVELVVIEEFKVVFVFKFVINLNDKIIGNSINVVIV